MPKPSEHHTFVKWEHRVTTGLDHNEIADMGEDGWQLVQVVQDEGPARQWTVIWKRVNTSAE